MTKDRRQCEIDETSKVLNNARAIEMRISQAINTDPNGDRDESMCHTPAPTVPPSPHLSIYRNAYNLADFNKKFDALEPKTNNKAKIMQKIKSWSTSEAWNKRIKKIFPWTDWLINYDVRNNLVADIIVGITVAVFQVPQSMGYCLIAHVPPVHGLYTAFFPPLVYALLGTSRHCAVGAFAIVSGVMTGNLVIQVMDENGYDIDGKPVHSSVANPIPNLQAIEVATAASLWIGIYMTLFGICRLGFISIYLSEQLISGFASAASIYVFTSQLRYLFGVDYPYRSGLCAIIEAYLDIFRQFDEINPKAAFISLACILVLLFFKLYVNEEIKKWTGFNVPFPIELFVVIGGTAMSYLLDLKGVKVVGSIESGLPMPVLPRGDVFHQVWIRSIPLAAVGYTITLSVGKLFGAKHGYKVDANQELVALGTTNLVGSCFGCLPAAASLPRSAIQEAGGGRTQLVSFVNCAALLIVILFLGPLLEKLPNCVLGSIIAVALLTLLTQMKEFKRYWMVSKLDGSMWITAFLGVIILDVDIGLYFGLVYSLLVLIYKSSRPKTYLLGSINKTDVYVPLKSYGSAEERERIKIYQFCGPLHFSSIGFFQKDLVRKTQVSVRDIIAERKKQSLLDNSNGVQRNGVQSIEDGEAGLDKTIGTVRTASVSRSDTANNNSNNPNRAASLPTHIIIDCSMFSYIDTSGIATLKSTVQQYESIGITTFLASCASHVHEMLERDNFFIDVPPHHVYISLHDAVLYATGEQQSSSNEGCSFFSAPGPNHVNGEARRDAPSMDGSQSTISKSTVAFPRNRF